MGGSNCFNENAVIESLNRRWVSLGQSGNAHDQCVLWILIKMFFNDHAPPHFHAEYAEFKATIDIRQVRISRRVASPGARSRAGLDRVASRRITG